MKTTHIPQIIGIFLFISCSSTPQKIERDPNIVIIFTDDQGYNDVACFGAEGIETPHLDQMAREGVRFTNFYSAQAVCSASRAALLTGCYPNRLGIHGAYFPKAKNGLNPQEMTIAELLKQKDYATAIYGKWHLGDHPDLLPSKQGFDEYFGIPFSNDMWPLHPANDYFNFDPLPLIKNDSVIDFLEDQSLLTTWITEHAVDFIQRKKDEPFFLYVAHPQPHVPLFVSDKFKGKSPRGIFGDVIMEIDWSVGEILKSLKENGVDDNTLVIFTSDNGPWLSYGTHSGRAIPLREGKGTSWEGGIREPFIARWPGKIQAGVEVPTPAMTIDLLPTIANLVNVPLPENEIDGKDIWPILSGDLAANNPHDAYFIYYKVNELHAVTRADGKWKLYFPHTYRSLNGRTGKDNGLPIPYDQNTFEEMELYNLDEDISETKNVIAQHPEIVEELLSYAKRIRRELGDKLTESVGEANRPVANVSWEGTTE